MARLLTRKLGATLRALTFQGADDADADADVDDSPYRGGYDIDLTYGRALPASNRICYPISSTYDQDDRRHGNGSNYDDIRPRLGKNDDYDGDRYGYGGYDGKKEKKPRNREPKNVGVFDSKPVGSSPNYNKDGFRYGHGDDQVTKKQGKNPWEYEYGYGGRRVRYLGEEKDPFGILMSYSNEDIKNKKKKQQQQQQQKRSYGKELEGVYAKGGDDNYKRSNAGGDGGGLFGRRSKEEANGKVIYGNKFQQKPRFGAPDEKGGGYDIPKYGVPRRDSETDQYGYGGRRWNYDDPRRTKRYGEGETGDRYGKFGAVGDDGGGYRRSNDKYGYGEKKRYSAPGQLLMPYEEEDRRSRQKLSSEASNYNPRYPVEDSEQEWMRSRDRRLWN